MDEGHFYPSHVRGLVRYQCGWVEVYGAVFLAFDRGVEETPAPSSRPSGRRSGGVLKCTAPRRRPPTA
jgi:hypothetical protein